MISFAQRYDSWKEPVEGPSMSLPSGIWPRKRVPRPSRRPQTTKPSSSLHAAERAEGTGQEGHDTSDEHP
jgi:hypothetical protein